MLVSVYTYSLCLPTAFAFSSKSLESSYYRGQLLGPLIKAVNKLTLGSRGISVSCDCVSPTWNRHSVNPRLICVHKKAQKKNRAISVQVMYALSRRVRLESSRPQLLQCLHAPSMTVEALVMRSKYPGIGSTSTGSVPPVWSPIVERRRKSKIGEKPGEILRLSDTKIPAVRYRPARAPNPLTSLLAHKNLVYFNSLPSSVA